nr:hypothetical protein [Tanacetum cinerariifolium]
SRLFKGSFMASVGWRPMGLRPWATRAFTASSTISSIYIQQFWDTVRFDKSVRGYKCQLDDQWFYLTKDTLRDALQITPVNNNKAFSSPPSSDALINFKALTTIINLCLTGKTSWFERPRAPVLQILWGVVNRAYLDYAERNWEEFTQSIHTFIEDKKNLAQHTHGKKKAALIVISSIRFTKLIIYHLQRKHKFHPRPDSPLHLPNEEPVLGYLKRTSTPTGSSGHDESLSLYVEVGLTDSEVESDEDAGPNPDEQDEGQTRVNPGDDAASQPLPSPVVHVGPNLKHMDLEVTDVSTQAHPEQMDEGFSATAYPKVQENLKLMVEEQVILEEPASSTGTLSSLQHLTKDLSFGDLFFNEKPLEADNEKTTTEIKVESMVDLPEADMKEILHQRMWETNSYKTHEDHMMLYEALEKSMNRDHSEELLKDLAKARKKKRRDSPKTPPGSPPHQLPPPLPLADLQIDDDMAPDAQAQSFDDEDIGNAHIPKADSKNLLDRVSSSKLRVL